MSFVHEPASAQDPLASPSCVIALARDRQLARVGADGSVQLPSLVDLAPWTAEREPPLYLGRVDSTACWLTAVASPDVEAPAGWAWHETRALLQTTTPDQSQAIACARQLHWWRARHRFCGCCGTPTVEASGERALRCPTCEASFFPSASPAVIVAITRGDRLLLAHNKSWRSSMFSLLAGFLDPGETLEQAVAREVREEVGIAIGDIRYVTSQPWPFPNSLMAGFRAVHVAGEIEVDGKEIAEAGWFTREALPEVPRRGSVARELIDGWLREGQSR